MWTLVLVWVCYGTAIYFSDDNDCQSDKGIFGWLVLMVIIIFLFYFVLILVLVSLCFLSCIACCAGKETTDKLKENNDKYIMKNLYNPDAFEMDDDKDAANKDE